MSNLDDPCAGEPISNIPLRIGAIFVILITSLLGTLFPIASLRLPYLHHLIPGTFFEFSKFFSSGIILSTGLIHLLSPAADEELSPSNTLAQGGCLPNGWGSYPFAYAICLSVIIGIDLAVTGAGFQVLFIVIVFHQMFEGLGVGTRLAFLRLPPSYAWLPYFGALLYAIVTPLGMIIGLAVRSHLSMSSAAASLASGILDSVSAGILIYAATVQLMAAEFIQSRRWLVCSWGRLWFAVGSFGAGAGVMALLAKWA
ncbi:ZIP zinc transporter-domain-containing protein [Leucosporidium creatinivorum]|uniref:ZIP zinc transporter-domain-containing protein n=1 Tax=Leucosporidium creatinivorum TaxID=106004 RepID=A0A1Y2G3R9_9BASI|nr:ZIP zinc transporter-domain-containing protein [Leucosporidium creatinivorum]